MLQPETLFVLGAGVSYELGFPLGSGLKQEIADLLPANGRANNFIHSAIFGNRRHQDITAYADACDYLRQSLPDAASVDNLIEHLGGNPIQTECAKIGITAAILQAERKSQLWFSPENARYPIHSMGSASSLMDIFHLIVGSSSRGNLIEAFQRVAFINFNYDRSLEFFFYNKLITYSGLSERDAAQLVNAIKIARPYGGIGGLPWSKEPGPNYGSELHHINLNSIVGNIKTFSEEIGSEEHRQIQELIGGAARIIFLGCAHHPQNIRILRPTRFRATKIYGTVYAPPPVDPDGNSAPAMAEFVRPSIAVLKDVFVSWQEVQPNKSLHAFDCLLEPLTSRQLLNRYKDELRDKMAA